MFPFDPRFDTLTDGEVTLWVMEKKEAGRVELPFYYYDICVRGVPVGKISIRIGDNFHTYYNGHIGYEVDEPYRGHGYAGRAARMVLEVARHHGMKFLYITCDEDNLASARTIEGLGARLLEICEVPREYFAWYEGIPRHRIYRLEL
ncbi:MAG: GNAT family N-acetyltransferase [Oscillospiraceae bacterium]|nr:GNAT family N-acetyltransferase [Oscillospiraceae bacterium]